MAKATIIYGSTTGMTEAVAQRLAALLGCEAVNVNSADASSLDADLLVLGTSTWGIGDLQDDWMGAGTALLESADLSGKKVAVFGVGDSMGFADSFCDGVATLVELATGKGAANVGAFAAADYDGAVTSRVSAGDQFLGLPLDETNESDKTDARLEKWAAQLKAAL